MSSLYLGTIGGQQTTYEIHAFTNNLPFREFSVSRVSDAALFRTMLHERYRLLKSGVPIYCTAINVLEENEEEYNPHDDRPGTIHFAAIDMEDRGISCVVSVAVDIGDKDKGDFIGLPLENRWRQNGYPQGASLDHFRDKYLKLNHAVQAGIGPWQMGEAYRHFKTITAKSDLVSRIGVYTGVHHLLMRVAGRKGVETTFISVFDCVAKYFQLYRLGGAVVLRDPTIESPPRHVSPGPKDLTEEDFRGTKSIVYNGQIVSRVVKVPQPYEDNGVVTLRMQEVPFMDCMQDLRKVVDAIIESPLLLAPLRCHGMSEEDMQPLRLMTSVVCKSYYEEHHGKDEEVVSTTNGLRGTLVTHWDFGETGL